MSTLTLNVPDRLLSALAAPPRIGEGELQMILAVKLYELGRLSAGAAAEMAGVAKPVFVSRLADYGVDAFRLGDDDLRQETRLA